MTEVVSQIVEVCLFRLRGDKPEFLLLRRASTERVYPGLWQFVSGKVKLGEDAVRAARREVEEETGMREGRLWTVPFVISFYDPSADAVNLNPFFACEVSTSGEISLSSEHDRSQWLDYDESVKRLIWPAQRQGLDVVRRCIIGGEAAGPLTLIPS
ncbi:MAG: NUDIX domain-containing protein [Ignavibacteria bacterium]|nr:NUDIX domain-containing protein [Ignavibacteria bacterium]